MAFAKNQMGVGFSAAQAAADWIATVNSAVTAAGTTQATATTISADFNAVTSGGASTGVILYAGQVGDSCLVFNDNIGNGVFVYPPVGHKFDNLPTNQAFVLGSNAKAIVTKFTSTRWIVWLSA